MGAGWQVEPFPGSLLIQDGGVRGAAAAAASVAANCPAIVATPLHFSGWRQARWISIELKQFSLRADRLIELCRRRIRPDDNTYAHLIDQLRRVRSNRSSLRENLLEFYADPNRLSPPGKMQWRGDNCRTSCSN